MKTIALIANSQRESAVLCARQVAALLEERGVQTLCGPELAGKVGCAAASDAELAEADMLVALGGDGTILSAARIAAPRGTPILGIHAGGRGSFGFLAVATPEYACEAVQAVLDGHYRLEERLMATAAVERGGQVVARFDGLNDLVIRAQFRMLKLRISVEDTYIATYAADGIIVATPTGSTAYNLAAGGPLLHPAIEAIVLTPICPHTLNVRSLLVDVSHMIEAVLEGGERDVTLLTIDGQVSFPLEVGDVVRFYRADHRARFVTLDGSGFYERVQTRLRLGERF